MVHHDRPLKFETVTSLVGLVHPTILRLCGWNTGRSGKTMIEAMIVMEWLEGGDLLSVISSLNLCQRILISYGIARGLEFCELNRISHRDLKPENILLDSEGYPRIADFGTGKRDIETGQSDRIGTSGYRPADAMQWSGLARDLYGYGCMTYEILNGETMDLTDPTTFPHDFPRIRGRFAPLLRSPGEDICRVIELSVLSYRRPGASFREVVQAWESIIARLDEDTKRPILEYKQKLDGFVPKRSDGRQQLRAFLDRLYFSDEVQCHLNLGPKLSNHLDCLEAVLAWTAKDDGCDNLELLEGLRACWDKPGFLDLTEYMTRDVSASLGPSGASQSQAPPPV
jgi:serine/threonine protein kinase